MKHAYLIIAHNEFDILEKQLRLLDDPRNDFYIHIDKKAESFPFDRFKSILNHASIHFIKRMDVRWGDFSLVKCELALLKAAIKGKYQYYHLLSGVDLPLKSNHEIHAFFDAHDGREFVHFCSDEQAKKRKDRVEQYHSMRLVSSRSIIQRYISRIVSRILAMQLRTNFRRRENQNIGLAYGAQWFSITHRLATYILENERWIKKHFRFTRCGDEHFLQTLIVNSDFYRSLYLQKPNDYLACMRCIDWVRGNPYVFHCEDFQYLIDSPFLFARKFSMNVDSKIITMIYDHVNEKNHF